jgi:hypothetical protein
MHPWTFDADNIDIRNITQENIYQYVVRTPAVESFLRYGSEDRKYFVVAPKGLGKTFLLKVKSKFYREGVSGYKHHCIPSGDELVEKLTSIRVSFSKEELGRFRRIETWEKTWELSLLTMILRNFDIELPSELNAILHEARTLLDILAAFLRSRNAIDRLYADHVPTFLRPRVGDLHKRGVNQIAIFIDNIDEGIEEHGYNLKDSKGTLSEDVWINAQLGMMKIARDICQRHKHIKIFVSIRSEAFTNLEAQTSLQYENISSILSYDERQIKAIFEQNINITERSNLARPEASDSIERFVGFNSMDHRFVKDHGKPRKEDTFGFINRHTFGRPREIVLIGSKIAEISVQDRRKDGNAVREVVNSVASEILLKQLKREIIPYFNDEVFERFCESVHCNVIPTAEAQRISQEIAGIFHLENVFEYLYSIGLVGTTEFKFSRGHLIQRFLPVGRYSLSRSVPPKSSKYFVIHSAVDKVLKDKHGPYFYNEHNIVGNDLRFEEPEANVGQKGKKRLHVHFGLGRDALALIIPELSRTKSIAVIQKPSKDDHELSSFSSATLRSGLYDPIEFSVVHDGCTETEFSEAVDRWESGHNIIVYSDNSQIIGRIISLSETLSLCSQKVVGKPEDFDLLPSLALGEVSAGVPNKVIYVCQRVVNKQLIAGIRNQLKLMKLDSEISVESCLIDRLEFATTKYKEEASLIYEVRAEEFGSIIARERSGGQNKSTTVIRRTKTAKEQTFYEDREKYLKEGIYRLTKLIKKQALDRPLQNSSEIYELFFDIQISQLASKHRLTQIYPNKSQTQIVVDLKKFCSKHQARFQALKKFPEFVSSREQYIEESKRMGVFPNRSFFQLVRKSYLFINGQAVLDLKKLLRIGSLKNYFSVFICFSARDEAFAKKLSDCLKKRGVDTYFFKEDHRVGTIKSVEQAEIAQRDKIVFIASKNSIASEECQEELSLGLRKRQEALNRPDSDQALRDIFVPIDIDHYIWSVTENDLERILSNGQEAWKNVRMVKQQVTADLSKFREGDTNEGFEELVDDKVLPALVKIRGRAV